MPSHRRRLLLAATALAALASVAGVPASAALSPNDSILYYRPGKAHTGILKEGVYTKKRSFELRKVDLAAATRSSLALYDRDTGKLRTGRFRGGVYTPVESMSVRTGFTHAAASCDTLLLYNRNTGRILTGTLIGGKLRNRSSEKIDPGWELVVASCLHAAFQKDTAGDPAAADAEGTTPAGGSASGIIGGLSGGDFSASGPLGSFFAYHLANTADSWMALVAQGTGRWGSVGQTGTLGQTGQAFDFGPWDTLAGTATSIQFYETGGGGCRWRLVGGIREDKACSETQTKPGWTLIAGGR